jgi:hypothetical protein
MIGNALHPLTAGGRPKSKLTLRGWKPVRRRPLVGFAAITLPIGLEIDDVAVFVSSSRRWANLPAKPLYGADGCPVLDDKGRQKYLPLLRWGGSHGLAARFSAAMIAAIEAEHGPLEGGP